MLASSEIFCYISENVAFRKQQKNPDHWFWALQAITEENPANPKDAGDLRKMSEAWLKWAKATR